MYGPGSPSFRATSKTALGLTSSTGTRLQNTADISNDQMELHSFSACLPFSGTKALDLVLQEPGSCQIDNRIPKSIKQGNLQ